MKHKIYLSLMAISAIILIVALAFSVKIQNEPAKCPVSFGCGGTSVLSWNS
ncbi:MAG: hypothetical protein QW478_06055 [Candidatus Micrarchaeaceae archaeon]